MSNGAKSKIAAAIIIVVAAAAWLIFSGGAKTSTNTNSQQTAPNNSQTPLPIDNSASTQAAAGGVDLQSSAPADSAVNPVAPTQSSVQSGAGGTITTQPPIRAYPPCFACKPAAGHVCPEVAIAYPCYCNGTDIYPNEDIACIEQQ